MGLVIDRRAFRQQRQLMFQGLFILETEKLLPSDTERINIGLELSECMKSIMASERSGSLEGALASLVERKPDDVFLDRIDVLFDPIWNCDPLKLLLSISRNRRIYIVWPGSCEDDVLSYSEQECPDGHSFYISAYNDLTFVKK